MELCHSRTQHPQSVDYARFFERPFFIKTPVELKPENIDHKAIIMLP
jgi:hypothetical protein